MAGDGFGSVPSPADHLRAPDSTPIQHLRLYSEEGTTTSLGYHDVVRKDSKVCDIRELLLTNMNAVLIPSGLGVIQSIFWS